MQSITRKSCGSVLREWAPITLNGHTFCQTVCPARGREQKRYREWRASYSYSFLLRQLLWKISIKVGQANLSMSSGRGILSSLGLGKQVKEIINPIRELNSGASINSPPNLVFHLLCGVGGKWQEEDEQQLRSPPQIPNQDAVVPLSINLGTDQPAPHSFGSQRDSHPNHPLDHQSVTNNGVEAEERVRIAAESVFAFRIKRTWAQQITISM